MQLVHVYAMSQHLIDSPIYASLNSMFQILPVMACSGLLRIINSCVSWKSWYSVLFFFSTVSVTFYNFLSSKMFTAFSVCLCNNWLLRRCNEWIILVSLTYSISIQYICLRHLSICLLMASFSMYVVCLRHFSVHLVTVSFRMFFWW